MFLPCPCLREFHSPQTQLGRFEEVLRPLKWIGPLHMLEQLGALLVITGGCVVLWVELRAVETVSFPVLSHVKLLEIHLFQMGIFCLNFTIYGMHKFQPHDISHKIFSYEIKIW